MIPDYERLFITSKARANGHDIDLVEYVINYVN